MPPHSIGRTDRIAVIASARSFLFVPGDRSERFDKAAESGADLIILDLEDAVAIERKDSARQAVTRWLDDGGEALVRLNSADTDWFARDLQLCRHPALVGAMLPKAEPGEALERIGHDCAIVALIETALATRQLDSVAAAPNLVRLAFGSIDLALDLGFAGPDEKLDPLRLELVAASRAARIAPPVGGVVTDFSDTARVEREARREAALGFAAKLCIHPAQVEPIHRALEPEPAEVERARRIVAAFDAGGGGAVELDGKMLDKPVVERARRLIAASRFREETDR